MDDRLTYAVIIAGSLMLLGAGWIAAGGERVQKRPPPAPVSLRRGRHARPRVVRVDPYPDVPAPCALEVPPRPDAAPVPLDDTAELCVINPDLKDAA